MHKTILSAIALSIASAATVFDAQAAEPTAADTHRQWADTIAYITQAHKAIVLANSDFLQVTVNGSGGNYDFYYKYAATTQPDSINLAADECREKEVRHCNLLLIRKAEEIELCCFGAESEDKFVMNIPPDEGRFTELTRTYTKPAYTANRNKSKGGFSLFSSGFSVGFVGDIDSDTEMDFCMGSSMEFTLDNIIGVKWTDRSEHNSLSLGFGLNWRTYSRGGSDLLNYENGRIGLLETAPEGLTPLKSRLKVFSMQVPFCYNYKWKKYFGIGFSAILNFNTHASIKQRYRGQDDAICKIFQNVNDCVRKVTVDFKASVQFCPEVALYVRYSPMKVLKSNAGAQFGAISTGLTFAY